MSDCPWLGALGLKKTDFPDTPEGRRPEATVTGCPTLEGKVPAQPEGAGCLGSEPVWGHLHEAGSGRVDPRLVGGLGAGI